MDFFDGMPLPDAVARGYDALDLLRGIEVFLNCVPGASMVAMRRGLHRLGIDSHTIGYTAPRCGSAPMLLTANTETTYGMAFLALDQDGPTVIEAPGNSLCLVNDMWQRHVTDMGIAGPDKGEGGKYLFLPPGHDGDVPDGYFVARPATFSSWVLLRALAGAESVLKTRIYPLSAAADPPEQRFVNFAESDFNTIHANDFSFFEEIDTLVQGQPPEALDHERAGQLAAIGIVPGKPFRPDDRMRSILDTAARIASGIVRTLCFKPRDPGFFLYPGSSWKNPWPSRSYEFLSPEGARLLDARAIFYYFAGGTSPAMAAAAVGAGSQYAYTAEDSTGAWLDGARNYTLTLPNGIPAKNFWAVIVLGQFGSVVLSMSPEAVGLLYLPGTVLIGGAVILAGHLVGKCSPRPVMVTGLLLMAASGFLMAGTASPTMAVWLLMLATWLCNLGSVVTSASVSETVLSRAPSGHSGTVASVQMAFAVSGAAFGPTVYLLLLNHFFQRQWLADAKTRGLTVSRAAHAVGAVRSGMAQSPGSTVYDPNLLRQASGLDLGLDFADGLRLTMLTVSVLPLVVAVAALLLMPRRRERWA